MCVYMYYQVGTCTHSVYPLATSEALFSYQFLHVGTVYYASGYMAMDRQRQTVDILHVVLQVHDHTPL